MFDLGAMLAVIAAFFVVTVSPGPANIAVATVSMAFGRRAGFKMGLGLSIGLAFWGVVAATGLGAVLQTSARLLFLLKVLGAFYLLWLAFLSAKTAVKGSDGADLPISSGGWFRRGLLLNLSNPKAVIAWMAALSVGLGAQDGYASLVFVTLICMALGFANYAGHAILFSLSGFMAGYKRARRWIEGVVASLFAAAGFGLLKSALSR